MYRIGICDDDAIFCAQIERYLNEYGHKKKINIDIEVFLSGEDYLRYMEKEPPLDLIFLDIELGGINGILVGQEIRTQLENEVTQIIYVSSKESYAMQLFHNRPMDFFVKPIKREDVEKIMYEYKRLFHCQKVFFEYHIGKTMYRVADDSIMYFQCDGKKIHIVTNRNQEQEFYGKMADVEKQINSDKFCVIHKSFIVNINYVAEFHVNEVVMTTGITIPISQSFRKQVKERILELNMRRY